MRKKSLFSKFVWQVVTVRTTLFSENFSSRKLHGFAISLRKLRSFIPAKSRSRFKREI